MHAQADFAGYCAELLAPLGEVRAKRMFGGYGLYVDDVFIAIVSGDALYMKVDEQTRDMCGSRARPWRLRQRLSRRRDPCSAAFSARMRMVRTAAFAAENASANPGSPRHSGRTAISPTTTT
jgi:hypothetical protein